MKLVLFRVILTELLRIAAEIGSDHYVMVNLFLKEAESINVSSHFKSLTSLSFFTRVKLRN